MYGKTNVKMEFQEDLKKLTWTGMYTIQLSIIHQLDWLSQVQTLVEFGSTLYCYAWYHLKSKHWLSLALPYTAMHGTMSSPNIG